MCGIVGAIFPKWKQAEIEPLLGRMSAKQAHRGPDDHGAVVDNGWGLSHVRLAIVDPSGGAQPFFNESKSIVLVGNHEIYNAPELRLELEKTGVEFKTHSDTEVVLRGYEKWGEGVFARLNGMFAIAIIDQGRKLCFLARDPMGIKPLHYARCEQGFVFGSEIKSLLQVPGVGKAPDLDAAHVFFNLRYLPGEKTLFQGVFRLEPGVYQSLSLANAEEKERVSFWDWGKLRPDPSLDFDSATQKLAELFEASVDRHLISDVPVAAYLSGGIDSSLVSTFAARKNKGIQTFCATFGEPTDESEDSALLAERIGSEHSILPLSGKLHRYAESLFQVEEPKVNCLQGFLLAEEVAKKTKVVLSGLGGDELFAGYVNNDILYPMCVLNSGSSGSSAKKAGSRSFSFLQNNLKSPQFDFYFQAADLAANFNRPLQFYSILRNSFDHNPHLMSEVYAKPREEWRGMTSRVLEPYFEAESSDLLSSFLRLELRTKLVNDFLLNEDRTSMAHGLEVRTPFLDQELVRFAMSLPSSFSYSIGNKKKILKQFAKRVLPERTLKKKKWGFSYDPVSLFRGELGVLARNTLTRDRVERLGLFSWKWVESVLNSSPSPAMRWHYFNLWVALGMVLWHEHFFGEGKLR